MKQKNKKYHNNQNSNTNSVLQYWSGLVFLSIAMFLGVSFFVWTLYPYAQMASFSKKLNIAMSGNINALIDSKFAFEPYTSVQPAIRYMLISHLFSEYKKDNVNSRHIPLIELAIKKMDETVNLTENYPQQIGLIAKSYDALADLAPQRAPEYHTIAEGYYKKAIGLSPGNFNQDAKFAYSINLANQGRANEAVLLMRETVKYDTRPPEPHYFLGLVLFKQGDTSWIESLNEMEYSFNHGFDPGQGLAKKIYEVWLRHFYEKKDVDNLLLVINRLTLLDSTQRPIYENVAKIITQTGEIPLLDIGK
jgi:tetratricopeptide (TPR) repeat protein